MEVENFFYGLSALSATPDKRKTYTALKLPFWYLYMVPLYITTFVAEASDEK